MRILITGSTGYLGKITLNELKAKGHEVSGIHRNLLYGPTEDLKNRIRNADVIIHFAGAPILQRWTKRNRDIILESRVKTTQNLVDAIYNLTPAERPKKFISASAVGIYKPGFTHDESSSNFDEGFVGEVVKSWESANRNLPSSIQQNIFRIGLVLGKNAKTITGLLLPFKLGLGATIGTGKQHFPFVHEKDVIRAIVWATEMHYKNGLFNLVAPENITNKQFTKALAKTLNKPAFLYIPAFFLKLVLGKASVLLTEGAEVEPRNLLNNGFHFEFPTIESALAEILK